MDNLNLEVLGNRARIENMDTGTIEYYLYENRFHKDEMDAFLAYKNKKVHDREEDSDIVSIKRILYYQIKKDGLHHRIDGPAIIYKDGKYYYYLKDKMISFNNYFIDVQEYFKGDNNILEANKLYLWLKNNEKDNIYQDLKYLYDNKLNKASRYKDYHGEIPYRRSEGLFYINKLFVKLLHNIFDPLDSANPLGGRSNIYYARLKDNPYTIIGGYNPNNDYRAMEQEFMNGLDGENKSKILNLKYAIDKGSLEEINSLIELR